MDEHKINKVCISNMYIEMTRKCNLQCKHCLRGDAQDKTISKEQLDKLMKNIFLVGNIFLGGGEPFLAKREVIYLLDQLKEKYNKSITFLSLGTITNGTIKDIDILNKLSEFADFLASKHENKYNDKGKPLKYVSIGISKDEWHDNNFKETFQWFKNNVGEHVIVRGNPIKDTVVESKRAVKNGLKYRKYYYIKEQHRFTLYDDKMTTIGDEVEIPLMDTGCLTATSTGQLISDGYYDYTEIDNPDFINYMGNYMEESIFDIINRWNEKHPLCERHSVVFEEMMRKAMTQTDRDRIAKKFHMKEQEYKKMKEENPELKPYEIYDKILHF